MAGLIVEAVASGCVGALESAVRQYPRLIDNVDAKDRRTPMHVAAAYGYGHMVEALHRLGSKALDRRDKDGKTPLHVAAWSGHAGVVETLHRLGSTGLEQPDKSGWTPMRAAAQFGHAAVAATLLRLGCVAFDQPIKGGVTPMHAAVAFGHADIVEMLIRRGSTTPDVFGEELLRSAFEMQHTSIAELLLAAGVDTALLAADWPEQVQALRATAGERVLELRRRLFFSSTLLDVLLRGEVAGRTSKKRVLKK